MLHTLFDEGLTRPAPYVDRVDGVRRAGRAVHPRAGRAGRAASRADDVRRLAREFAAADGGGGVRPDRRVDDRVRLAGQWAIQCLNILTGNFDQPGGVLFTEPAIDVVGARLVGTGHYDLWRSRVRGLPEFGGELPAAVMREEIETPGDGQIRAMLTLAGNPVLSTPDGRRLDEALAGLDFMASVDIYLNETTRHADVILPPTTALERDHYDLVFHGLAVRNTARFTPAVLPKPAGAMHDWEIYRELARVAAPAGRTGPALSTRLRQRARLAASPTRSSAGLLRTGGVTTLSAAPAPRGRRPRAAAPDDARAAADRGPPIDLAPDLVVADLPRLQAGSTSELASRRPTTCC